MLMLLLACAQPPPVAQPRTAPHGAPTWSVATFNVNFGLDGDADTLDAALALDVDLLALQESTPWWHAVAEAELGAALPHQHTHYEGAADGMALLSRHPMDVVVLPPQGEGWFCSMLALVETPLGPVQVLSVHLRPPLSHRGHPTWGTSAIRAAELEALLTYVVPSVPLVVLGDLNEQPGGAGLAPLAEAGLVDGLPRFDPDAVTWGWTVGGYTVTRQLDHVLYDRRLDALAVGVRDGGYSDHRPVRATFVAAPPAPRPAPRLVRRGYGS